MEFFQPMEMLLIEELLKTRQPELAKLFKSMHDYQSETDKTLRFIPTEGRMSALQKSVYFFSHHERYLHAPSECNQKAIRYPDIHHLQVLHKKCQELAQQHLKANFVNVDFLSGLQVMEMTFLGLSNPGDLVLTLDSSHGGHESAEAVLHIYERHCQFLPFDLMHHVVNVDALDTSLSPALIYMDHSNILHPHNLRRIKEVYPDALLVFDISQIMVLVMAGLFPNPLLCGADAVVGSTHKSLNGPQKALLATNNKEVFERIQKKCSIFISNNHPADVAALAVVLTEFKIFGYQYAVDLQNNANVLAESLIANGVLVYECRSQNNDPRSTLSQHVWIDCEAMEWSAEEAVQALAQAGIIVNTLFLPRAGKKKNGSRGLRLGTTEVTRLGMTEDEMRTSARLIAKVLLRKVPPKSLRPKIEELRKPFQIVQYCHDLFIKNRLSEDRLYEFPIKA